VTFPLAAEEGLGERVIETLHHHLQDSYELDLGGLGHIDLNETINHPLKGLVGFDPHVSKQVVMMLLAATVVAAAGILAARLATRASGRGLVGNCVESIFLFLRDEVVRPNVGEHHARAYLPWFATFFFFILACNLIGLCPPPLGSTATGNISVTAALAILTFFTVQGGGMVEKGVLGYWTGLVPHGVAWWMWPLVFVIELVGLLTKPFALTVRLFANMTAGHVILGVLSVFLLVAQEKGLGMSLLVAPPSLVFYLFILAFEVFVALIQAYIFTTLSSIFVGLALSHEH
jgi:F-type H+-transporting ATPase subunit a